MVAPGGYAITVPTLVIPMLARVLLMYARTVPGCLWITCGYPVDNFGAGEGGLLVLIIVVPTSACKRVNLTKNSKKEVLLTLVKHLFYNSKVKLA